MYVRAKGYISITFDYTEVLLDEIVFEFREVFDVVYTNIDGSDYAKTVIKGGTLNVDFLENASEFLDVYVAGVVLDSDSYTYTDGVFTVEEVSGNVEVVKFLGISFSIDGVVYRADEGMTLEEWVESEYNTGGFASTGSTVCTSANKAVNVYLIDEVIEAGAEYFMDTYSRCAYDED